MKSIGILGGIGPQATIEFEARLHRAAQRVLPQHGNEGYPPIVSVYMRHAPVLVKEDSTPSEPLTLDPRILETAKRLGEWVDLIVSPSNTPHFFIEEIAAAAGREFLSIVDATVPALRRDGRPVGLVGLGIPKVWARRLAAEGFSFVTAGEPARLALDAGIIRLMEGAETDADRAAAREACRQVREAGAGQVLLGCTEVPLLLGPDADDGDLVNPAEELAVLAIDRARQG